MVKFHHVLLLAAVPRALLAQATAAPSCGIDSIVGSRLDAARYRVAGARAERLLAGHVAELAVPGMQAAVAVDGRVVWSRAFGSAHLEQRTPVTPLTRFRIGSVSKMFTAAALLRLHDERRIDLDAPIQRYVPDFPPASRPVTARLLAGHLAGVRHYGPGEAYRTDHFASATASLAIFAKDTLLFEPGARHHYSSYGFNLLGAAIEGATGKHFLTHLSESVLEPLGLRSTGGDHADSLVDARSEFYVLAPGFRRVPNPFEDNSAKWPSGGLLSTAEDLVRFGSALAAGPFLSEGARRLLVTPQRTRSGEAVPYGIGANIARDAAGRLLVHHDGSLRGARAALLIYPEQGVVVAILANTGSGIFFNVAEAEAVASLFLDAAAGRRTSPSVPMGGVYAFETTMDSTRTSGLLQLYCEEGDYRGLLTLRSRPNPIPVVLPRGASASLVAIPGGTWMSLEVDLAGERPTGRWRRGNERGELEGLRKLR